MRKLIKFSLYFFLFILLGLMFGYLTFKTLSFSRTVEMPNLYGKSLLESNKLLTNKDLYLKIEGEDYDSTVPPGVVIRQDVPAGKKVKERRAIKVVISKGPRVKSVPEIVNKTLADAESLLLQKGLKVREIMVHSDTVEKDKIVAQKPGPDEQASDTVTVLVSLGPYNKFYYCPDFRGMSAEQANDVIKKLGMKISIEGTGEKVETQRPDPGRQIKGGDTIYLKLS
jgi:beta-lactam-binding protein with PASTA domain